MFNIREGKRDDCKEILKLIPTRDTGKTLSLKEFESDGFERTPPNYRIIVAEDKGKIIGFLLYIYWYAAWEGPTIHIEELNVSEEVKGQDYSLVASLLLKYLAKIGVRENLPRITVISNISLKGSEVIFKSLGGIDYTELEGWLNYSFDKNALEIMAK